MVSTAAACGRPASRLRFCVVGSRWESLGEGLGDPGGVTGATAAWAGAWGKARRKGGHLWSAASLGLASRPRGPEDVRAERATQPCFCHEIRTPEPGKALGLCLGSAEKGATGSSPFPDVSKLFSRKSTSRLLVTHWLPPPCGENWLLEMQNGKKRVELSTCFNLLSGERE